MSTSNSGRPGSKFGADKFRKDLYLQAEQGFCMGFYVQFQSKNVKKTPIEDASLEWPADLSPLERVAQLQFFPQKYSETEKSQLESMCTKMAFNPWHALEEHRPLGNQNRARRSLYETSRAHIAMAGEPKILSMIAVGISFDALLIFALACV